MLRLVLIALLAVSAQAQDAAPPTPSRGQHVLLVGGALAGGVLALPTGPFLVLGAGVGTYATSAALGLRPTVGGVLIDTAVGTGVGLAAGGAVLYAVTEIGGVQEDLSVSIGSLVVGLVVGSAAVGASHGVRLALLRAEAPVEVAPAVLAAPTGEAGPGLRLTVGL